MKKFLLFCIVILSMVEGSFSQTPPTTWNSRGLGGGGALFSPSINQGNNSEYYISCDMSELFHTTDYGLTYSQVHFSEFIGGHNSKVCFTSTPNLLFSISYPDPAQVGLPVKSTDNGATWAMLAGNPDPSEDAVTIHVDYAAPTRVIISTYGEIFFSANGGTTFTSIHTAANTGSGNVVGGVFFDGLNIYIGTNDGVLVSANGGINWTTAPLTGITNGQAIWSFAGAKAGGITRFFCLTALSGDVYVGLQGSDYAGFYKGVYSCDYGTGNWVAKNTGITASHYPMYVDMAENDINIAYLAGSNSISEPIILKTINAGNNWTNTFLAANNQNISTGWSGQGGDRGWSYGECPFGFDVAANNPNYVVFGDFGFPHKTSDGGTTWKQAYVDTADQHPANASTPANQNYHSIGIENTTSWQVHWINATDMWSCFSDIRGKRSTDGGASWSFNYTGHTANSSYRIAQGSNGTLYMGTSNVHDMYQSTRLQDIILDASDAQGKILYSTDNGLTWAQLHSFGHPVFWVTLDPNNPNRAYASVVNHAGSGAAGGVYRCDNLNLLAAATWTLTPAPPRTEGHPASLVVLNDGKLIATYSGRRNSGGTFTASSGCFIYNPSTNSWTDVSHSGMYYWTKDIVVDPNDATQNTWYVCVFSGWGGAPNGLGGLYRTTNRGAAWTKLTGSILDRVTSCTFNPNSVNEIYLTTEVQGLWISSNINSGTPTFSNVTSYPFRQPERVFFNPNNLNEMWVTSFGNGMKMGALTPNNTVDLTSENDWSIYPNPASSSVSVMLGKLQQSYLFNAYGQELSNYKLEKGTNKIDISHLPNGIYFLKIGNTAKKIIIPK